MNGVVEEGDPDKLFDPPALPTLTQDENAPQPNPNEIEEQGKAIPTTVFNLDQGQYPLMKILHMSGA